MYPDRIVVQCNEDGFTEENLTAICSVGASTKTSSYGYIGAKGIGFKSVFIAASKVEIRSGYYNFHFKHEKTDTGLGMVLPMWQDTDTTLIDLSTRMTLHLHQNGEPEEIEHLHQIIFKQFEDLEETCLLFLRNLKQIRVTFLNIEGRTIWSKMFSLELDGEAKRSLVTLSTHPNGETLEDRKRFLITRFRAMGLPKSENRELPDTPEARQISSQAEIILAFPLTAKNKPLLELQATYAFLPIRKTNLKVSCTIERHNLTRAELFAVSDTIRL